MLGKRWAKICHKTVKNKTKVFEKSKMIIILVSFKNMLKYNKQSIYLYKQLLYWDIKKAVMF